MSYVSTDLLGATLDEGSGYYIKESAQSESGVASITNVQLETFKFIGSESRVEYLMPQMTQMNWALRAFENRIPDCRLLFEEAMSTPDPMHAIELMDELLRLAVGSAAAPCLRVIPGVAILQNAYRSAESLGSSLNGEYNFRGYIRAPNTVNVMPRDFTPAQFSELATDITAGWQRSLGPVDLEAVARLIKACRAWTDGAIGVNPETWSPDAVNDFLKSLSIYQTEPEWAKHQLTVDTKGHILIDGSIPTRSQIADACPPGHEGDLPYNVQKQGGTRALRDWIASHNEAMDRVPSPDQIELFKGPDVPGRETYAVRDAAGRLSQMTRAERLKRTFDDQYVARLYYGNKEEFIIVPNSQSGSVTLKPNEADARAYAHAIWVTSHGGLPSFGGEKSANTIISLRKEMIKRRALVPGVTQLLRGIADVLASCPNEDIQILVDALEVAAGAKSPADLDRSFSTIAGLLKPIIPTLPSIKDGLNKDAPSDVMNRSGYTVIGTGRYASTNSRCVALVPVRGRGVAPVEFARVGHELRPLRAMDVAVVLEEPPSTVYSPVKTMIGTALLARLIDYLNGYNTPAGYNFDVYQPTNPFGSGQARPCPHALLNRQIDRYEAALVHVIENADVSQMPDILSAVQKLSDAKYFLNFIGEIIDSIINREDWIYMLQSLIVGLMVHDGATIRDADGNDVVSVDAGVVPREAAEFIFGTVLADIRRRPTYDAAVDAALNYGLLAPPAVDQAANLARIVRAEVLLARAINGLDLLVSLMDGSNALVKNVHVSAIQHLIDVDLAKGLLTAVQTALNRDYLGLIDRVEFEAPWDCAEWTTQFGAFAFSVRSSPIHYEAVDLATEISVDSGMGVVATALTRVGFSWSEIAPAALRVRGADQSSRVIIPPRTMALVGVNNGFYNNAPIAHQMLKVTVVAPSYDVEAYNLVKAYLTMNTSRTYFAQPVGRDISEVYNLRIAPSVVDPVLDLVINADRTPYRRAWLEQDGFVLEKTPALANVALIMPYVSNYLQKPAITRDIAVPEIIDIDGDHSLAGTSGVVITLDEPNNEILTPTNGLAITVHERKSVSTPLPWVGS